MGEKGDLSKTKKRQERLGRSGSPFCQIRTVAKAYGEVEASTTRRVPCAIKPTGFGGPRRFTLVALASPGSQVRARLGPGGYCRRSGNQGTQTCLPAAQGVAPSLARDGPSSPTTFKSLARGQASRDR